MKTIQHAAIVHQVDQLDQRLGGMTKEELLQELRQAHEDEKEKFRYQAKIVYHWRLRGLGDSELVEIFGRGGYLARLDFGSGKFNLDLFFLYGKEGKLWAALKCLPIPDQAELAQTRNVKIACWHDGKRTDRMAPLDEIALTPSLIDQVFCKDGRKGYIRNPDAQARYVEMQRNILPAPEPVEDVVGEWIVSRRARKARHKNNPDLIVTESELQKMLGIMQRA